MLTAIQAAWVYPVSSDPIADGALLVDRGRIVDVGPRPEIEARLHQRAQAGDPVSRRDAGPVVLMPGLINAHTHLELAALRGRVPPAASLPQWVAMLMAERGTVADEERDDAVAQTLTEMRGCGTSAVGDVANGWATVGPLSRSPLAAVVFHELIGFDEAQPAARVAVARERALVATSDRVRVTLAAHAPYSTSPALIREIAAAVQDLTPCVMSMHVAESPDETDFLRTGRGPWRTLLERLGKWSEAWTTPATSTVGYLDAMGIVSRDLLAVHATQCDRADLERLAAAGASVVTCPRSNAWVGVGAPPVQAMLAAGVRLAVGTDSLASAPDASVFEELRTLATIAPDVPARRWIEAATLHGAQALRMDGDYGALAAGRRADVLAVALGDRRCATAADVETRLVSGVQAADLEWMG